LRISGPVILITQTFAGVVLAVSIGVVAEWLLYLKMPGTLHALWFAPFALSTLTFLVFPSFWWFRKSAPIGGIVLFTLMGLVPTVVGGAILMNVVSCHFGACINL
jgi:hypothetical protein